jgi:hypothetical protein
MLETVIRIMDASSQRKPIAEIRMADEREIANGSCSASTPTVVITSNSGESLVISIEDLYGALELLAK